MYFVILPFSLVSYILYKLFRANFYYNAELIKFLNSKEFSKIGKYFKLKKDKTKGKDLLIIGDSMGLSIGAEEKTLHAIFKEKHGEHKNVEVVGKCGSRANDLYKMARNVKGKYKTIWVFIGPNDVTSLNLQFNRYLDKAFKELRKHSSEIVWSVGDVDIVPMFPSYIKFVPRYFGGLLKRKCYHVAKNNEVKVLKIVHASSKDPFYTKPNLYFAKDGFHPNDTGYQYIFDKLHSVSSYY
jgi:lysophospholipase L1-like esterase